MLFPSFSLTTNHSLNPTRRPLFVALSKPATNATATSNFTLRKYIEGYLLTISNTCGKGMFVTWNLKFENSLEES